MKCVITKAAGRCRTYLPVQYEEYPTASVIAELFILVCSKIILVPRTSQKMVRRYFFNGCGHRNCIQFNVSFPKRSQIPRESLLRPKPVDISKDKKKPRMQFYWLPKSKFSNGMDVLRVPVIPETDHGSIHEIGLWDVRTGQQIRSWHV
jgi:hypothetical protein